jgi:hypothetical protein
MRGFDWTSEIFVQFSDWPNLSKSSRRMQTVNRHHRHRVAAGEVVETVVIPPDALKDELLVELKEKSNPNYQNLLEIAYAMLHTPEDKNTILLENSKKECITVKTGLNPEKQAEIELMPKNLVEEWGTESHVCEHEEGTDDPKITRIVRRWKLVQMDTVSTERGKEREPKPPTHRTPKAIPKKTVVEDPIVTPTTEDESETESAKTPPREPNPMDDGYGNTPHGYDSEPDYGYEPSPPRHKRDAIESGIDDTNLNKCPKQDEQPTTVPTVTVSNDPVPLQSIFPSPIYLTQQPSLQERPPLLTQPFTVTSLPKSKSKLLWNPKNVKEFRETLQARMTYRPKELVQNDQDASQMIWTIKNTPKSRINDHIGNIKILHRNSKTDEHFVRIMVGLAIIASLEHKFKCDSDIIVQENIESVVDDLGLDIMMETNYQKYDLWFTLLCGLVARVFDISIVLEKYFEYDNVKYHAVDFGFLQLVYTGLRHYNEPRLCDDQCTCREFSLVDEHDHYESGEYMINIGTTRNPEKRKSPFAITDNQPRRTQNTSSRPNLTQPRRRDTPQVIAVRPTLGTPRRPRNSQEGEEGNGVFDLIVETQRQEAMNMLGKNPREVAHRMGLRDRKK